MSQRLSSILAALLLAVLASTATAAAKSPLKIAFIDPLSGPAAGVGQPALAQLRFDVARMNRNGGINGHPIEIVALDDQMNPKKALVQLQKATDQNIHYIIHGIGSSVASALINAVNKHNRRNPDNRVLYFNYAAVATPLTNERCSFWHFRFDSNADMKMDTLTDWVAKQEDVKKVFLINPDYSFGRSVSKAARTMLAAKRPDIEIVGNAFFPMTKVKDFSPYVSQIKASGADAVITGNWGQDMVLLVKSAAAYGLDIPFLTYYGNSAGTASAVGEEGVGRIYVASEFPGDFTNPELAQRQVKMYKETGWDFVMLRITDMLGMLEKAIEKAGTLDPTQVAFALESLKYESPTGTVIMRAKDHQILMPAFISVMQGNMEYGLEGTDYNFHALDKYSARESALPTTCKMRRPKG